MEGLLYLLSLLLFLKRDMCEGSATLTDMDNLFTNVILNTDRRYRPLVNQSKAINVEVGLNFISLTDINEIRESMSCNIYLTLIWQDEIRTWTRSTYGGITRVTPEPLDVWRPRLYLSNSVHDRDMFADGYAPLNIRYDGGTEWFPGGIMHTSCTMVLTYFPFDQQICKLIFLGGPNSDQVQLTLLGDGVFFHHYNTNGEWEIVSYRAKTFSTQTAQIQEYGVIFFLTLRRIPTFIVLSMGVPVNTISFLSSMVFLMPVESGERMSFSITVLLSLSVYTSEVSSNLPNNSDSLPLLMIYLACLLLHSALAAMANMFVLMKYHRSLPNSNQDTEHTDSNPRDVPTKDFVSVTEKFGLTGINGQPEKDPYRRIRDEQSAENNQRLDQAKSSSVNDSRLYCGSFLRNHVLGSAWQYLKSYMQIVLTYITLVDFILFIVFVSVWLLMCIVFMVLMTVGGLVTKEAKPI